jgi:hypothetical protein
MLRLGRKNRLPIVATLNDVLRLARNNVTGKTRHGAKVPKLMGRTSA